MRAPLPEPVDPLPLRILIVDDERPARRRLRRLLDGIPGIAQVFEAASGRLALEVVGEAEPDVVFLDVSMPGMDGFEFLETLGTRAGVAVIFVTAHDEHALRAFDVQALDYLVKPVDEARLRQAVERARASAAAGREADGRTSVQDMIAAVRQVFGTGTPARLLVEASPGRRVLLPVDRIVRIEADRNDAVIVAADRRYRLRTTLAELEARLDPDAFLRINRSEIVNLDQVLEVEPLDHGDARVHLAGGDVRRISRRYTGRLGRFK